MPFLSPSTAFQQLIICPSVSLGAGSDLTSHRNCVLGAVVRAMSGGAEGPGPTRPDAP
jgi:hypothetical protein